MPSAIPGVGFLRLIKFGLQLDDRGFSSGLARANARISALDLSMQRAGGSAGVLRGQFLLLGFAVGAFAAQSASAFAQFESETLKAAFAAEDSAEAAVSSVGEIRQEAVDLVQELNINTDDILELRKEIARLGDVTDAEAKALARAGGIFSKFTDETGAREVTEVLFRLANSTSRTEEEMNQMVLNAEGFASGLLRVADASAAGTDGLVDMVQKMQVLGISTGFTAEDIISLAGAISDLDDRVRRRVTSSIQRLFLRTIPNAEEEVRSFLLRFSDGLGESTVRILEMQEGVSELFQEDPLELFKALAIAFENANRAAQRGEFSLTELGKLQESLDLDNIRDLKTLALGAANAQEKLGQMQALVNGEIQTGNKGQREQLALVERFIILQGTTLEKWKDLITEVQLFTKEVGRLITKALDPLITGFSDFFKFVNDTAGAVEALTVALVGLPTIGLGLGALKLGRNLIPGGGFISQTLGGGGARFADEIFSEAATAKVSRQAARGSFIQLFGQLAQAGGQLGFTGEGRLMSRLIRGGFLGGELPQKIAREGGGLEGLGRVLTRRGQEQRFAAQGIAEELIEARVEFTRQAMRPRRNRFLASPLLSGIERVGGLFGRDITLGRASARPFLTNAGTEAAEKFGTQVTEAGAARAFTLLEQLGDDFIEQFGRATGTEGGELLREFGRSVAKDVAPVEEARRNRLARSPLGFLRQGAERIGARGRQIFQLMGQARGLGFAGLRGAARAQGARGLGRTVGKGALRALGGTIFSGPAMVLELMARPLAMLADKLRVLGGENSGLWGAFLSALGLLSELLSTIGNVVGLIVDIVFEGLGELFNMLQDFWNFLNTIPGLERLLPDSINQVTGGLSEFNDEISEVRKNVRGDEGGLLVPRTGDEGGGGGGQQPNVEVNVQGGADRDAVETGLQEASRNGNIGIETFRGDNVTLRRVE